MQCILVSLRYRKSIVTESIAGHFANSPVNNIPTYLNEIYYREDNYSYSLYFLLQIENHWNKKGQVRSVVIVHIHKQ